MSYLIIKWIHILSFTIFFGTGIGSAFYMFAANRKKDINHICFATKYVVLADWIFTTPSVITQFFTGLLLLNIVGYSFADFWVVFATALYFFVVACWLIVVWMQIKMRNFAKESKEKNLPLPKQYWAMDKIWILLGFFALPATVAIFWLMVAKPVCFYC